MVKLNENDYPHLYQAADETAVLAQRYFLRLTGLYLIILMVGAVLSTYSEVNIVSAYLAAGIFLTSIFLTIFLAFKRYDKIWYSTRAIAEIIKTRTWYYMMRSQPYKDADDVKNPKQIFLKDLKCILEENKKATKELLSPLASHDAVSQAMEDVRALPLNERIAFYKKERIDEQKEWYNRKSLWNKKKLNKMTVFMILFQAVAFILIMARIVYPDVIRLPAEVFIAAAASMLAWIQIKRYSELAASYGHATHEVSIISSLLKHVSSEEEFSDFINETEKVFTREHTQWVTRRNIN